MTKDFYPSNAARFGEGQFRSVLTYLAEYYWDGAQWQFMKIEYPRWMPSTFLPCGFGVYSFQSESPLPRGDAWYYGIILYLTERNEWDVLPNCEDFGYYPIGKRPTT
jgi:hypothetical protein